MLSTEDPCAEEASGKMSTASVKELGSCSTPRSAPRVRTDCLRRRAKKGSIWMVGEAVGLGLGFVEGTADGLGVGASEVGRSVGRKVG